MQLIVNEYGTIIKREGNRFLLVNKEKNKKEEFSADLVKQIVIAAGASVSSKVVKLAMDSSIDIVYINKFGTPYARIYPCKLGGTTLTRKKQAEAYSTAKSLLLSKSFVEGKIKNQSNLLKSLAKSRSLKDLKEKANKISKFLPRLQNIKGKNVDSTRNELLGIEGFCASEYFSVLSKILPFKNRDRESKDPVNILLNYGYGILYSEIEKACIIAGLDPYLGYFHTDRYGKPSMVLDLIEEFRAPIVDRAIITLFVRKLVNEEDFVENGETKILSDKGKEKVIKAIMERLHTQVEFGKKKLTLQGIILEQARSIVRFLLDETDSYKPYIHKW